MKEVTNRNLFGVAAILFCFSIFIQSYFVERENFPLLASCIAVSVLSYLLLIPIVIGTKENDQRRYFRLAVILHLIPFFSIPSLSNDVYRFIWDGELLNQGINPYDFKPNELIWHEGFLNVDYYENLYEKMGFLSQENYSCYPVFNQAYFYLSTLFTDNTYINTLILRALILGSLFPGFYFLDKLIALAGIPLKNKWMYVLNPLLIVEVSQNLHFEGVMISFIIMGIYFLAVNKLFYGSLFLALAIQIKLVPLIVLPFLLRWIGWKKSIISVILVFVFTSGISFILINPGNYLNFGQSLALYFRQFEFNSFILHYYLEYGDWKYGYNRIQSYGPYLSVLAAKIILILAWYGNHFDLQTLFKRLFFAFFAYYVLSTTVHPWYLLTPLLFGVFTSYRFILVWTLLVFLSYISYSAVSESTMRIFFGVEYVGVFGVFLWEVIGKRTKDRTRLHNLRL